MSINLNINPKLGVRDLGIADKELNNLFEERELELAKAKVNHKVVFRLSCRINALMHANDASAQKALQIELMQNNDDNNEKLVKKLRNKKAEWTDWASGHISVLSTTLMIGTAIGSAMIGAPVPAAAIEMATKLLQLGIGGVDKLSQGFKAADQSEQQELRAGGERFQQGSSDKQTTYQSVMQNLDKSMGHEQSSNASDASTFQAMVAGMR